LRTIFSFQKIIFIILPGFFIPNIGINKMRKIKSIFLQLWLFLVFTPFFINAQPGIKWQFETGAPVYSSPAYYNGYIYEGSDDGIFYCLDAATGEKKWSFNTSGFIRCRPAVNSESVFFQSDDGKLYALDPADGSKQWSYDIKNNIKRDLPGSGIQTDNYWDYMQSSPCVNENVVYTGSGDSCIYAVNTGDGTLIWKVKTKGIIRSTPFVDDNYVYAGSFDGYIYAFDKKDGSGKWKFDTGGQMYKHVQSSPVVVNGILYCGSRNPFFYAIEAATGKELWRYSYGGSWVESSAVIKDNIVYVGSSDIKCVFAFEALTGKKLWECNFNEYAWSSPAYYDGVIYTGLATFNEKEATGGKLAAIDASNGKILWEKECGKSTLMGGVVSSPLVIDNIIYYGSLDGKIYSLEINK
jgi:eukaryotic-like serine/threonine-protein kinase